MRQIWIPRSGPPEVLEVREAPDPQPEAHEVRIRVRAAGINFADVLARMAMYPDSPPLPAVVGYEVAGDVDAVGPAVTGLAVGDRVAALTRFFGYADMVCVPQQQVAPIGADLPYETAAAIPVQYLTAWIMLIHLGNVQAGDRVLVHSAGGGVGLAAIDLARWRGAEVIGTASAGKHERLRAAGVSHCIDYRTQDFAAEVARITAGAGVQLAIDAVGGASFRKSYRCLAPLGRLYVFGVSSMAPGTTRKLGAIVRGLLALPTFKPIALMNENRGVHGVNLGHLWEQQQQIAPMLLQITELVSGGTLQPTVDRTFSFAEAAAAHRYIQERRNFGKVLLTP